MLWHVDVGFRQRHMVPGKHLSKIGLPNGSQYTSPSQSAILPEWVSSDSHGSHHL